MALLLFHTGNTYSLLKEDGKTLEAFKRCLEIRQKLSPTHRYTGFTCHKIGVLMRGRADLQSAIAFFRSAIDILLNCEAQAGAASRSKFVLAKTLKENGDFDEADEIIREVHEDLAGLGESVVVADLDEAFFDRYVLFCHR